jgi:hypothetical protein
MSLLIKNRNDKLNLDNNATGLNVNGVYMKDVMLNHHHPPQDSNYYNSNTCCKPIIKDTPSCK